MLFEKVGDKGGPTKGVGILATEGRRMGWYVSDVEPHPLPPFHIFISNPLPKGYETFGLYISFTQYFYEL